MQINVNPYVDGTANNAAENINTKTVNRGDKLATKYDGYNPNFDEATRTISIISRNFRMTTTKLSWNLDTTKIKASRFSNR